jgi:hypothetical protein
MEPHTTTRANVALRALPALALLLGTWVLLWLAQGIPTVCALARPCPADDVRVAPALLFGGLMLVPTTALVLTARGRRRWEWVRPVSYLVLVGSAVAGLLVVLFSGGFAIPMSF